MKYYEIFENTDERLENIKVAKAQIDLRAAALKLRRDEIEARVAAELAGQAQAPVAAADAERVESEAQRRRRLAREAPINRLIAYLDADGIDGVGHAGRRRKPPRD
jgi:phage-related baseplate assembly protein